MTRIILSTSLLLFLAACDAGTDVTDGSDKVGDTSGETGTTNLGDEDGDGYKPSEGDCDDNDANVNPGAAEECNGLDDDCDGEIDEDVSTTYYRDSDGDGFGDLGDASTGCEPPEGYIANSGDCDDVNAAVYPGAEEVCNEIDDNCDGNVDEGVSTMYYADADRDGYGDPNAEMEACEQPVGAVADNTDCDDTNNEAFPGNEEICDEADNDCDGLVDEGVQTTYYADADGDGHGDPFNTDDACVTPMGYSSLNDDCDDTNGDINPDATEMCNGWDDDCDGTVDEDDAANASTWYADADGDAFGDPSSTTTACDQPLGYVNNSGDCDDANSSINPTAAELCNGYDDDCDGSVDESAVDASTYYADDDGDGYGDIGDQATDCSAPTGYVSDSTDCDDGDAGNHPGATEVCDGEDNDCDGAIDEEAGDGSGGTYYADVDADTFGDPDNTVEACGVPAGYTTNYYDCNDGDNTEPMVVETTGSSSGDGSAAAPYDSIQDGINGADECVIVYGGTYGESSISLDGKSIDVWGVEGASATYIDPGLSTCDYTNPEDCESVFLVNSGSGASPSIHGFTVSNGTGYGSSSISTTPCADSDPGEGEARMCTVTTWEFCGGGAYIEGDSPSFSDMVFSDNMLPDFEQIGTSFDTAIWVYSFGGGVCASNSFASFDDVNFLGNTADQGGGVWAGDSSSLTISHSWFDDNNAQDGGGIALDNGSADVSNSVLACNTAGVDGGGIFAQNAGTGSFVNSVFSQNDASPSASAGGAGYNGDGTTISVNNSVAEGSSDATLFMSAGTGWADYSDLFNSIGATVGGTFTAGSNVTGMGGLLVGISCDGNRWNDHAELAGAGGVDAGDPAILDADGGASDLGAYGGPEGAW